MLEKRIYAGNRAKEVLENEVFQSVMADLKQEITNQWMTSPARDAEGREKLWNLLKMAEKFELMLRSTLESGTLAKLELEHKQGLREKASAFLGLS